MKSVELMIVMIFTLMIGLPFPVVAHTPAESNEVVRVMLDSSMNHPDNLDREGPRVRFRFYDPAVFFGMEAGQGWTPEGRRAAFEDFVEHMGTVDFNCTTNVTRRQAAKTVAQCANFPVEFRTHTKPFAGAGKAYYVQEGNLWFVDGARTNLGRLPWSPNSCLVWKIPIGWHRKDSRYDDWHGVEGPDYERRMDGTSRPLLVSPDFNTYKQENYIDVNGVFRIDKFGHWISRSRDCKIRLDGTVLQRSHPHE